MKPRARVRPATCDAILHGGVTLPLGIIAQHVTATELRNNAASIADIFCSEKKEIHSFFLIKDKVVNKLLLGTHIYHEKCHNKNYIYA